MKTRLLSIIMCALFIISLTACGGAPNKENDGASDTSENGNGRPEQVTEVFSFKAAYSEPDFSKHTFYDSQNGNTIPYRLYLPDNYISSAKKYPVVLYLHGAGEIGDDNEKQYGNAKRMFNNNMDLLSESIIVCPQSYEWWHLDRQYEGDQKGTLGSVLHLLNDIKSRYPCDADRIYVTGLSMGGYATWDLLAEYGDIFAAGMPICGGGDYSKGYELSKTPIRIYHSKDDDVVPFYNSKAMYDAIKNAGGKQVTFIELDGLGHSSWEYAYSDREAFCWLFAQHRENNPTGEYEYVPYFRIENAKGEIIITEEDIKGVYYQIVFGENGGAVIDLALHTNGRDKLARAYKQNPSDKFTVYWSTEKLYTFTVSGLPIDHTFSIANVFDKETAEIFYDAMEGVVG